MIDFEKIDEIIGGISGVATNKFLELLLDGMKFGFQRSAAYRENIKTFKGSYIFRTADNSVCKAAIFDQGQMEVADSTPGDCDACVTFATVPAFQRFLFSRDHDILNSLLTNELEVEGNLNYIYRFGYMAKELQQNLLRILVEGR